jgi:PPOX class probable F420-dependent enzyme
MTTPGSRPDPDVARRLRTDEVAWLTTVDGRGRPQSSPVWFHWDGADALVLTQPHARKVANIGGNPLVALHLDGAQAGATVVTIEAEASLVEPDAARLDAYAAKYADGFVRLGIDAPAYLARFSTRVLVRPTRLRTFRSD